MRPLTDIANEFVSGKVAKAEIMQELANSALSRFKPLVDAPIQDGYSPRLTDLDSIAQFEVRGGQFYSISAYVPSSIPQKIMYGMIATLDFPEVFLGIHSIEAGSAWGHSWVMRAPRDGSLWFNVNDAASAEGYQIRVEEL